MAYSATCEL
ncbi:Protein of unknown function [Escherichia coli D6-113.11]|nr:Protein of unknown function [Escherichia coli D6-113.11]CDU36013.1 Protein of unknown function [Escherichia coli D6-113.11]